MALWEVTQAAAADDLGVNQATVSSWVNGIKTPSTEHVIRFAQVLDEARRRRGDEGHNLYTILSTLMHEAGVPAYQPDNRAAPETWKAELKVGWVDAKPLVNEDGRGLAIDVLSRIARGMGYRVRLQQYDSWPSLFTGLRTGAIHMTAPFVGEMGATGEFASSETIGLALRHVLLVHADNIERKAPPRPAAPRQPIFWAKREAEESGLKRLKAGAPRTVTHILDPEQLAAVRFLSETGSAAARYFAADGVEILHAASMGRDHLLSRVRTPGPKDAIVIDAIVCDLQFALTNAGENVKIVGLPDHLNPATPMTFAARRVNSALLDTVNAKLKHMRHFGELRAILAVYEAGEGLDGFVLDPGLQHISLPKEAPDQVETK